ncbi:hypothetical protein PC116_g26796 [Phytophthora cactorum]|nr:hypothetical protein Pcac1_g7357 [Phytophthora cactorum]KAG2881074.1 hypothetical protein PC115_g22330 [Phytophthora cactorum]KAG4224758.1 hypothetical protein PC116_g26796 [Phytophthora cactorum]
MLSIILYTPEVEGSLISVSKPPEKDVVAQFNKDKCGFCCGDATVMEAKRCGNVYKLNRVGDEVCYVATTRKEQWTVEHASLDHMPYKCYEQLLPIAEGESRVADGVKSDDVCARK